MRRRRRAVAPDDPDRLVEREIHRDGDEPAGVEVVVVPRSFEVVSGGVVDALDTAHRITISYDAARLGADGQPDLATSYSALNGGSWASDEQLLNAGVWDVVRFRVVFDLDAGAGGGAGAAPPRLSFLRLPFRF